MLSDLGVASKVIQKIMRHERLATTERYLHRISDVRNALKLLEGGKKGASKSVSNSPEKIKELTVNG